MDNALCTPPRWQDVARDARGGGGQGRPAEEVQLTTITAKTEQAVRRGGEGRQCQEDRGASSGWVLKELPGLNTRGIQGGGTDAKRGESFREWSRNSQSERNPEGNSNRQQGGVGEKKELES